MSKPKTPTAVEKLQLSTLRQTQLEMMGEDVDLNDLYLALNHKDINIGDAILDVSASRTIEGASTITATVEDRDRVLLRSGRLSARNDIEIDGLFFRLASVQKSSDVLTLVFEDREIAILRTYSKPIKQSLSTSRTKVTRAEFVLRMIREVKEFKIRYVIPKLTVVQPIGKLSQVPPDAVKILNRSYGIPRINDLTVKGAAMTEEQRRVANIVLDTGVSNSVPLNDTVVRKLLVMSMMAAIQESDIKNDKGGGLGQLDSVGVFQQRKSQGWPATRDIATDSAEFFRRLRAVVTQYPNMQYTVAIQQVQHSGFPNAYAQWRTEAERIVTSYGLASGSVALTNNQYGDSSSAAQGDYEFYRGIPPTKVKTSWGKESSWDCIKRLANEVQWRAFFVSGTFYFVSDDDLLKSQPIAVLDEGSEGVISIDGDYAEGTRSATVTLTCTAARWAAPPGTVIQLTNMGPWDGRWLVNQIDRSLFSKQATITLKKKQPRLPEPATSNIKSGSIPVTWSGGPTTQPTVAGADPRAKKALAAAVSQLGLPYRWAAELESVAFDCSGLTQWAYSQAGIAIPRVAQAQYDYGILVQDGILLPGDLVFFGKNERSVEHVGIYVGDNYPGFQVSSGTMIDAPHTGAFVRFDSNFKSWTDPPYVGATRPTAKGKPS